MGSSFLLAKVRRKLSPPGLGVRSRAKALETLERLGQLGYLTYELDKETKKLTYQISVNLT
jgi:hypothetical protein